MAKLDSLYLILKTVSDLEILGSDVSQGFSFKEISELIRVETDLKSLKDVAPDSIPEWQSLSDSERAELVQYVEQNCKYPGNLQVEAYVQKALVAAILLSKIFEEFKPVTPDIAAAADKIADTAECEPINNKESQNDGQ